MKIQLGFSKGKKYGIIVCDSFTLTKTGKIEAFFRDDEVEVIRQFDGKIATCFAVNDKGYYVSDSAKMLQILHV
jgi:hypothetical protein